MAKAKAKAKAVTQEGAIDLAAAADTAADTQGPVIDAGPVTDVVVAPVVDPVVPPPEPEPKPIEMVKALVLVDCVFGKCGEVAEFAVDQAEAIRAAGYIDTHPNAVASARTE